MKKAAWIMLVLALLPALSLMLYKPLRVFAPSLFGLKCPTHDICIDDESQLDKAESLYQLALDGIQPILGELSYSPKFIFCATQKCFESFGFKKASAQTIGTVATVIGPKGWTIHYLKHELVHQWQADKIGSINMLFAPEWLTEGMAYTLSDDPRQQLSEPWQSYRTKFEAWFSGVDQTNLVMEIKNEI